MQSLRNREEPAFGNRLRAPRQPFASVEDPANERMGLQLLEEVVHRQLGVAVVEPHDHPERHQVLPERTAHRTAEPTPIGSVA